MNSICKKIRLLIPLVLFFVLIIPNFSEAHTGSHENHPSSDGYKKYWFYDGWGLNSSLKVNINYTYTQKGDYWYGYRFQLADSQWSDHFNFFNINKVSSNPNLEVVSDNYGDTGWVGRAYYTRSPKDILLNEWYHKNRSNYSYVEYERTSTHELGHTHGLNHTSYKTEIMSNAEGRDISQTHLGDGDVSGIRDIY